MKEETKGRRSSSDGFMPAFKPKQSQVKKMHEQAKEPKMGPKKNGKAK